MPTRSPCAGIEYSIQPGDTCYSISEKQSIGTGWLLTDNDLQAYCTGFPANGKLCLHNICKTYVVQDNDTCSGIAKGNNITQSQLIAYNPTISPGCYNIRRLVNSSVCVSSPGPQYQAPSSVSLAPLTATAAAPVPNNARELSNRECGMWYQVGTGDYCNMLVLKFGISLVDFVFLNPTINSNCTNLLLGMSPAYFLIILHNSDQNLQMSLTASNQWETLTLTADELDPYQHRRSPPGHPSQ
jgi:hypothetical protein